MLLPVAVVIFATEKKESTEDTEIKKSKRLRENGAYNGY